MNFDWHLKKAEANLQKHAISFDEATLAFEDEFCVDIYDDTHSTMDEKRYVSIGEANGRILFIAYTILNEDTNDEIYWLISAREAETWEIEDYEQEKFRRYE
jgi:uncharacterized DUF497 family protein